MFIIYGTNILTFNTWVLAQVDTREEALDILHGARRLESNPHIEYELAG